MVSNGDPLVVGWGFQLPVAKVLVRVASRLEAVALRLVLFR